MYNHVIFFIMFVTLKLKMHMKQSPTLAFYEIPVWGITQVWHNLIIMKRHTKNGAACGRIQYWAELKPYFSRYDIMRVPLMRIHYNAIDMNRRTLSIWLQLTHTRVGCYAILAAMWRYDVGRRAKIFPDLTLVLLREFV